MCMKLSEESTVTAEVAWFVSCDFFTGDYHVPQRSDLGCSQPKTCMFGESSDAHKSASQPAKLAKILDLNLVKASEVLTKLAHHQKEQSL